MSEKDAITILQEREKEENYAILQEENRKHFYLFIFFGTTLADELHNKENFSTSRGS